jgi:uncharacterized HhH-GPD family protein
MQRDHSKVQMSNPNPDPINLDEDWIKVGYWDLPRNFDSFLNIMAPWAETDAEKIEFLKDMMKLPSWYAAPPGIKRRTAQLMSETTTVLSATLAEVAALDPFDFRWPAGMEHFEGGWEFKISVNGDVYRIKHGVGGRVVYGRQRVHTITWLDGWVQVEGVEADDYPTTRALLSVLRHAGKAHVRQLDDVPSEYAGFDVVDHHREVDAPRSPRSMAVKIREDDLARWGLHALLRQRSRVPAAPGPPGNRQPTTLTPAPLPPPPKPEQRAVARALLDHGTALAAAIGGATTRFTPNDRANALIHADPFAFLVAVIADQGIVAERAWTIPFQLKERLGHLDPAKVGAEPEAVRNAFTTSPKLHRFVNDVAAWVSSAGRLVMSRYGGDASRIWSDAPAAATLRARFDAFPGIGQKKAAMAVEILERDLGVRLTDLAGSDIAYDIHVRRVFLRTGIAQRDDVGHMVAVARALNPDRPGALDNPAWDIGRRWCQRGQPDCPTCPLLGACPRYVKRGNSVRGI